MLDFNKIQQKICKYTEDGTILNEENTKMTLVAPFIAELGFDVFDIDDVVCEYTSDMRENGNEKVDYAIMLDSQPKIFIEVKPLGTKLNKYVGQLKRYYVSSKTVKWGVLTDGETYMFFNDSETANIMDDEPFYILKISELIDKDLELLSLFAKDKLREGVKIDSFRINTKLTRFLNNSILKPDDDFLDYIDSRIGEKLNKAQYTGILNNVLNAYFKTIINNSSSDDSSDLEFLEKPRIIATAKAKLTMGIKKPKGYVIFGEYYRFISWKELLVNVLNYIIDLDIDVYKKVCETIKSKSCFVYSSAEEYREYFADSTNKDVINSLAKSDDYIMHTNIVLNNDDRIFICLDSKAIIRLANIAISLTDLDSEVKFKYD